MENILNALHTVMQYKLYSEFIINKVMTVLNVFGK